MKKWQIALIALLIISSAANPVLRVHSVTDTRREEQYMATAQKYIEETRTVNAKLVVVDAETSKPIPQAKVGYDQASHDFILTSRYYTYTDKAPELMRALGLGYRDIWVTWRETEPQKGVFDFKNLDWRIQYMEKTYPGTRSWAWIEGIVPVDPADYSPIKDPPEWTSWKEITNNPSAFEKYKQDVYDYVYNVVSRYKTKIKIWMTQNEINYLRRFTLYRNEPLPDARMGTVKDAVELDRTIAKAIRDADRTALIVLGTSTPQKTGPTVVDPLDFAKACIDAGVDFDAVGFHIYPWNGWSPADYYEYLQNAQSLGKKVFPHEVGYVSATPTTRKWDSWKWRDFNEDTQAEWLRYTFTFSLGTKNVIGYGYFLPQDRSTEGTIYGTEGWGLIRTDGTPKKAYGILKDLIRRYTAQGSGVTDQSGAFTFRGLAGDYSLKVEAEGYTVKTLNVHIAETQNNTLSTSLAKASILSQLAASYPLLYGYLTPIVVAIVVASLLVIASRKRFRRTTPTEPQQQPQ